MRILAGDIGGTKTVLTLYHYDQSHTLSPIKLQIYPSSEFKTFDAILNDFMLQHSDIDSACFGIAGPVIKQRCETTNLPWIIDAEALKISLRTDRVKLLNDLEAMALGMLKVKPEQLIELNPNAIRRSGNKAVIAAGTGLGQAILNWTGEHFLAMATEGGHSDFAPLDLQQDELLQFLRRRFPDHVSYERILSGDGFSLLHDFLIEQSGAIAHNDIPDINEAKHHGIDRNAVISKLGLTQNDAVCSETVKLFCKVYGAEAGNLVLKSFAIGGLFIGGGIAPKILPALQTGEFLSAFLAKGRFKEMLSNVSVKVCTEPDTPLIGAMHYFVND